MNTSAQTQLIKDFEQHYQYDATYLHELLQHSPAGYEKFVAFRPLSQHREQLSPETYWVAKIAAMQVADCGNCLQLIVRMALEAGVAREWVLATLQGGSKLPEPLQDIYDFATCVASYRNVDPVLQERIQRQLNKAQLIELGICIATTSIYPTIKRALGYTVSCSLVEIEA